MTVALVVVEMFGDLTGVASRRRVSRTFDRWGLPVRPRDQSCRDPLLHPEQVGVLELDPSQVVNGDGASAHVVQPVAEGSLVARERFLGRTQLCELGPERPRPKASARLLDLVASRPQLLQPA